jgi:hypothetical protein
MFDEVGCGVGGGIVGFTSNPASLLQVNASLTLGILSHSHRHAWCFPGPVLGDYLNRIVP